MLLFLDSGDVREYKSPCEPQAVSCSTSGYLEGNDEMEWNNNQAQFPIISKKPTDYCNPASLCSGLLGPLLRRLFVGNIDINRLPELSTSLQQ